MIYLTSEIPLKMTHYTNKWKYHEGNIRQNVVDKSKSFKLK